MDEAKQIMIKGQGIAEKADGVMDKADDIVGNVKDLTSVGGLVKTFVNKYNKDSKSKHKND